MTTRANLTAYSLWQVSDYVTQRGILSFVVGLMVGAPVRFMIAGLQRSGAAPERIQSATNQLAAGAAATLGVLIVLLAVQRSVSGDRADGYYRFYFSKPVPVWTFYLQRYVAFGAGLLVMVALLLLVGLLSGVPVHVGGALGYFLILYLAFGGIGFLCSAVTRYDWSALAVIWFGALLLRTMYAQQANGWRHWLAAILPRVELMDGVRGALFDGVAPSTYDVAWLVGYGVVCLVLGLVIIQRRPLAS